ncbi:hypothetical protein Q8W67_19530 [Methylobacterium sp. NEAU K]|nr:hypothetical protein [Methylobacterium sp. NEAU K]MDP4005640.1 hypothetical protein [Methylobacterium sp. NEAU K]
MALTGRFWFRRTWLGKVVLLVEEEKSRWFHKGSGPKLSWRDANLLDLAEPPLRTLMTLERTYRAEYAPSSSRGVQAIHPAAANSASAAILRNVES